MGVFTQVRFYHSPLPFPFILKWRRKWYDTRDYMVANESSSAPAGAAATALIIFFLPSDFFPSEPGAHPLNLLKRFRSRFTLTAFRRLDLIGVVLMLAASILLVFALEEAGTRYAWGSVPIIVTLVVAVGCWVGFVGWEIGRLSRFSPCVFSRTEFLLECYCAYFYPFHYFHSLPSSLLFCCQKGW
jgi:asparagine N-glycosylation enzyme membrane subunit Stt3